MSRFTGSGFLLSCLASLTIGVLLSMPDSGDGADTQYSFTYLSRRGNVSNPKIDYLGYNYDAMWNVRKDPDELVHIVFYPFGTSVAVASSIGTNHPVSNIHISSYPDGLYLKGERVCVGKGRRVFVYTEERKLKPIPLKQKELKALLPDLIDTLYAMEVWKKKIKLVLDEEAWRKRTDL